jgi:hypothetical protein
LDQALRGDHDVEPEVAPLVDAAHDLEVHFDADVPNSARERAFFVEAVAARRHRHRPRLLLPAIAGTAIIFVLGFTAGSALPGDRIYPVRKAMASVGLVASPAEQVRSLLREATTRVTNAEALQSRSPQRARDEAFQAISLVEDASRFVGEMPAPQRFTFEQTIATLRDRAAAVIGFVIAPDDNSGPSENSGPGNAGDDDGDDNSGSGSGDDDDADDLDDDDSSGSGSDDDDDDSSGPGSGDTDDDNSGPGSDDSDDLDDDLDD